MTSFNVAVVCFCECRQSFFTLRHEVLTTHTLLVDLLSSYTVVNRSEVVNALSFISPQLSLHGKLWDCSILCSFAHGHIVY